MISDDEHEDKAFMILRLRVFKELISFMEPLF